MKKLLLTVSGVLLLIIIIVSGWFWLGMQIERSVTAELSRALDADVKISSVNTRLFAGQLQLVNGTLASRDSKTPWSRASFAQASATLKLTDLFAPVIPLTVSLDGAELELKPIGEHSFHDPAAEFQKALNPAAKTTWPRVRLQTVSVKNLTVRNPADATFTASGIGANIELAPNETSHLGSVTAASLTTANLTLTNLSLKFTSDPEGIRVDNFLASVGSGLITGSATLPNKDSATLDFTLDRVPVDVLLSTKWSVIISGLANGGGTYKGNLFKWQEGYAQGAIRLEQAALKAPPFLQPLKQLTPAFANLGDISLDTASATFVYRKEGFVLEIELVKKEVFALHGINLTVNRDNLLNGRLQLGIPSNNPLLFPKLKTDVFTQEYDGWSWADFTVSGTPGNWQEDLSPRVKQALGGEAMQLLDKAKDGLDKAKQKAGELLDKILGR